MVLHNCATVAIHDEEFCGDAGPDGASCFHFLTTDSRDIPKQAWDVMREGMICESTQAFSDWKADIEKLCSISHRCTYDQQKQLEVFFSRVEIFKEKQDSK